MLIPAAFAQAAAPASAGVPADGGPFGLVIQFAPLILVAVVFYFLLLRPQQQRQKQHAARIAAVKRGDTVITAGGVQGKVTKVEDQFVEGEIAQNTRVRVVKSTLTDVAGTAAANH